MGKIEYRLIHTGQHYDRVMSGSFFEQLNIPQPDINLGVGVFQAYQTANIMIRYEEAINDWKPEMCIVVGDVTSTMACALVAKKAGLKVAHVEGGIRSGDMSMPEEINRIVTDSITDYFFTTSNVANANLRSQGVSRENIFFVGNTMIDSLMGNKDKLIKPDFFDDISLGDDPMPLLSLVATLHSHLMLIIPKIY
ncbi:MAG: UDP-N-acetylglucosamine 2-epimerase [Saprospiraceae bacterium]